MVLPDEAFSSTPLPPLPATVVPSKPRPMKLPHEHVAAARIDGDAGARRHRRVDSEQSAEPAEPASNCRPAKWLKSTSTVGVPAKPGAVVPSMFTLSVMAGRAPLVSWIVPATLKLMTSLP